jgi:anti-sigma regulatory factor (Ser/Thr protein kinase)
MEIISFSVYTKETYMRKEIEEAVSLVVDKKRTYIPEFFDNLENAIDYLTYGQTNSRLFIVEYNPVRDKKIREAISRIYNDPWLHGSVIIVISEEISLELASELIQEGVIDFISIQEILYKLPTIIKISSDNSEIFETQQFSKEIKVQKKGNLTLRNDLSLVQKVTSNLMNYCYAAGFRNLEHFSRISLSLHEMITNAIEHGNCEIGFKRKTEIIQKNLSMVDVVNQIATDPKIANRKVRISYDINSNEAIFIIKDEGKGFKISELSDLSGKQNIFAVHGRGIMMTKKFVDSLKYNDLGNQVKLVFKNNTTNIKKENPITKFSSEGTLHLSSGDTLIEDGSESYYFYYIVSGKLGVFYNGKMVDTLTPEDIFVGEMAFLNRNRRTGTVKALTNTTVLPISRRGFIDMIKTYPYAGVVLARLLTKRLVRRNKPKGKLHSNT